MHTILEEYGGILKKHITLCDVSKKYTFERMRELLPEATTNAERIRDILSAELDASKLAAEEGRDNSIEIPLSKMLPLNKMFQKQDEYETLLNYLPNNLIVSVASSYDIYLSALLKRVIIDKKRFDLVKKEVPLCDVLKYSSIEQLASSCVDEKISDMMRKSHKDQIEWVEKALKIDIINSFSEWKTVFEFFQIRNVVVHNDGIVNQTFIEELKKNGISTDKYEIGKKIKFDPEEISKQIHCIVDFSVYLFSLILRAFYKSNDDLMRIDEVINNVIYNYLCQKKYTQVVSIVDNILKNNQRHCNADVFLLTINKCIALKYNGNSSYAKVLEKLDWSNCDIDFKFARAILLGDTEEACALMESLDKKQMIPAYVEWPLCKDFIKTSEFRTKFKEIYGTDFEETLSKLSNDISQYWYENNIVELSVTDVKNIGEQSSTGSSIDDDLILV